jgi:hypothetical protein
MEKGKPILYLDQTWVEAVLKFRKCWQNKEIVGIITNVNASNRLYDVHLDRSGGFLKAWVSVQHT